MTCVWGYIHEDALLWLRFVGRLVRFFMPTGQGVQIGTNLQPDYYMNYSSSRHRLAEVHLSERV
jgi:hypothetical protein